MTTLHLIERAGEDGMLRLNLPVDIPGEKYHVVVHIERESATTVKPKTGWPPGFFEETAGMWEGDFDVGSEGDYEERLPL